MICLSFRYFHLKEIYIQIWNKNDKLLADGFCGLFLEKNSISLNRNHSSVFFFYMKCTSCCGIGIVYLWMFVFQKKPLFII